MGNLSDSEISRLSGATHIVRTPQAILFSEQTPIILTEGESSILTADGFKKVYIRRIIDKALVRRITFDDGSKIDCMNDTKFKTSDGIKPVEKLQINDKVKTFNYLFERADVLPKPRQSIVSSHLRPNVQPVSPLNKSLMTFNRSVSEEADLSSDDSGSQASPIDESSYSAGFKIGRAELKRSSCASFKTFNGKVYDKIAKYNFQEFIDGWKNAQSEQIMGSIKWLTILQSLYRYYGQYKNIETVGTKFCLCDAAEPQTQKIKDIQSIEVPYYYEILFDCDFLQSHNIMYINYTSIVV